MAGGADTGDCEEERPEPRARTHVVPHGRAASPIFPSLPVLCLQRKFRMTELFILFSLVLITRPFSLLRLTDSRVSFRQRQLFSALLRRKSERLVWIPAFALSSVGVNL